MKRILTILCTMITAIGSASAQNPMAEDMSRWADGWKHAFSKEGVREWKPEFTLRYYAGGHCRANAYRRHTNRREAFIFHLYESRRNIR